MPGSAGVLESKADRRLFLQRALLIRSLFFGAAAIHGTGPRGLAENGPKDELGGNNHGACTDLLPGCDSMRLDQENHRRQVPSHQTRPESCVVLGSEIRSGSACNAFHQEILEVQMAQSIVSEFMEFLKVRKRYWLLPILILLGLISALIILSESSAIAPFIYTLF
jgi:Family of unknown function (DUF5989)